eukprot:scaffold3436_cov66-Cylindrotheca_fusiformis.AAC.1
MPASGRIRRIKVLWAHEKEEQRTDRTIVNRSIGTHKVLINKKPYARHKIFSCGGGSKRDP